MSSNQAENTLPQKRRRDDKELPSKKRAISNESETIFVLINLTPIRKSACELLERDLARVGVNVLPSDSSPQGIMQRAEGRLLIVTEDEERTRKRFIDCEVDARNVLYVSLDWAISVLQARKWIPLDSYIPHESEGTMESNCDQKKETRGGGSQSATSEPAIVSPAWCVKRFVDFNNYTIKKDTETKRKLLSLLPTFLCQRATITQAVFRCRNWKLCEVLDKIAKKRLLEHAGSSEGPDDSGAEDFKRASAALKCLPYKIKSEKDASCLASFGPNILDAAREYVTTGTSKEAEYLETDERVSMLAKFADLYGLEPASARNLYDTQGIRSIDALRGLCQKPEQNYLPHSLSKYMQHHDSVHATSIGSARAYCQRITEIANSTHKPLNLRLELCGDLRRGETQGHTIDIVYCRGGESANDHTSVLKKLVLRLQRHGLLQGIVDHAYDSGGGEVVTEGGVKTGCRFEHGQDIVFGIGRFQNDTFRVRIIGVRDRREFSFATLLWSGSTAFRRDMIEWCRRKKGWILSTYGLFEVESEEKVVLCHEMNCEVDIFAAMGLPYRPVFERSC